MLDISHGGHGQGNTHPFPCKPTEPRRRTTVTKHDPDLEWDQDWWVYSKTSGTLEQWVLHGWNNMQTVTAEQQELLLSSTYCHCSQVTIFRAIQYFVVSPLRCSAQINKKTSQVIMRVQIRNMNTSLVCEGANKMTYGYEHWTKVLWIW